MSGTYASTLRGLLSIEKIKYLEAKQEHGGTAQGFRDRIRKQYEKDSVKFTGLILDALMEATTRNWQEPPRKHGPDLFSIILPSRESYSIAEHLTRTVAAWYEGEDENDETKFEKVLAKFATITDFSEDAQIKMRKAAQSSAAAEQQMRAVDEARRRAKGRMDTLLRDIAD